MRDNEILLFLCRNQMSPTMYLFSAALTQTDNEILNVVPNKLYIYIQLKITFHVSVSHIY